MWQSVKIAAVLDFYNYYSSIYAGVLPNLIFFTDAKNHHMPYLPVGIFLFSY
jgi:hypothetical protein